MQYFGKIRCISFRDLTTGPEPIMSASNYKKLAAARKINVINAGKGLGNQALVEVATMPQRFQERIKEKYGDMNTDILRIWLGSHYEVDQKARAYYINYRFDNGESLPVERIEEYTANASTLKAVISLMNDTVLMRKAMKGGPVNWNEMTGTISYYQKEFGHTLPLSANRFKKKVNDFQSLGYESLISKKFRNQNSRKVTYRIDGLIKGLKAMTEHPYDTVVAEMYNQFVTGDLEVFDPETGELFNPADFTDKNGNPMVLGKSTIAMYLNNPLTNVSLAKVHQDQWSFNNSQRPYHLRKKGCYSGSQISLDDRDLPHKMHDGTAVKSYLAFDVTSEAVVGYAYSKKKTGDLFLDCIRNMYRTFDKNGLHTPAELQVEHHLVNDFADGLMKSGEVFPLIYWCNPGNSREKHAEQFHRLKKYSVEKREQNHIGRWYAKLDEHRTKVKKIYDAENNTYVEPTYSYDEIVADDIRAINEYNSALHSNQKKFPGLTRWDVFMLFQNPDLQPWEKSKLYRYIGEHTSTTIRQNAYLTVQYNQYRLSSPEIIGKLAPRNYKVEAYYMPDDNGDISEVYIYQNERLIDVCHKVVRYNTATVEQTEADREAYLEQAKYLSEFDSMVKRNKISRVGITKKEVSRAIQEAEAKPVEIISNNTADDYSEYIENIEERYGTAGAINL